VTAAHIEVNIGRTRSTVIEFAIDEHKRFLGLCDPASREYEILKTVSSSASLKMGSMNVAWKFLLKRGRRNCFSPSPIRLPRRRAGHRESYLSIAMLVVDVPDS
jgi:hypothetical protein